METFNIIILDFELAVKPKKNMSPEEVEKKIQKRVDKHKGLVETSRNNGVYLYSVRYENGEYIRNGYFALAFR